MRPSSGKPPVQERRADQFIDRIVTAYVLPYGFEFCFCIKQSRTVETSGVFENRLRRA
jgi:hypothetical protein